MRNLGKIVLVLLLLKVALNASIRASVDATSVELGEMVTYSLHLKESANRPIIQTLCGVNVISTSSQSSIEMVNGKISRNNTFSYKFIPQKDCVIEPMEIEVDGVVHKSNAVEIKVTQGVANADADFILSLESSTKEVYVGEPFEVTLLFKQKLGAEAVDSKFEAPVLKGFWIKNESQPQKTQEGGYVVTKIIYKMAAQRAGELNISKAQMSVASRSHTRDSWGSWVPKIKWRSYYSNELNIDVKPLPKGVGLVGSFNIVATVDKNEINANEALNLTLEVVGDGNLEDIKSFKPYIDGVNVFDEKISIEANKLTQKMAFVAQNDFTIQPFTLKYFDPKTKETKTITTDKIEIKVKNSKPKEELVVKKELDEQTLVQRDENVSSLWTLLIFVLGVFLGLLIGIVKPWKNLKKQKSLSLKDERVLLVKMLPYKDDEEVKKIIEIIEQNIYTDKKIEIDKKLLREIVKKYISKAP
ncbi:MAG: BatD family protein [Sulfurimonas sp.]|nr:BatD family protein [Sulfurimonas sp.]MDD3833903.1 BatD family protein [Sulfurimonas sp.]